MSVTKLISGGETIVLPPTTGNRTIATAGKVFIGGIYGADACNFFGKPTPETHCVVHQMIQPGATFDQVLTGIATVNIERYCFSQEQVVSFCEIYPAWLDPKGTLFFFKQRTNGAEKYFIANVFGGSCNLQYFNPSYMECTFYSSCLVVPAE